MDEPYSQSQFRPVKFSFLGDAFSFYFGNFFHIFVISLEYLIPIAIFVCLIYPLPDIIFHILNLLFEIFVLPIFTYAFFKNSYDLKTKGQATLNLFSDVAYFFVNNYIHNILFFIFYVLINLAGLLCLVVGVFFTMGTFSSGFVMRTTHPELSAGDIASRCWSAGEVHGNMWIAGLAIFLWAIAVLILSFLDLFALYSCYYGSFMFWVLIIVFILICLLTPCILMCIVLSYNVTSDPQTNNTLMAESDEIQSYNQNHIAESNQLV
ncbi:hypothetical protein ADUPG1_009907 [Aduncisulcus paluster]|uniref:Uncharacterized protein n=1 Tax=Aduncisulcus paluster TaxID=2918883 RepID=A0ABQ5KZD9_9EUKA|nr:hypothetical protein ADUPG1_009907 [Aduncisulcus paluster]